MNSLSKNLTKICECLGVIHYNSCKSTVSSEYQYKYILIEAHCILGKVGHKKRKRKDNQKYTEQKYIVHKIE